MPRSPAFVLALAAFSALAADPTPQAAYPLPRTTPESVGMSSERLARLGEVIEADVQKGRLPGAVIAIARKGKLIYYRAFGYLDREAGTKMTTDAIFNIASMTKPVVAVGALELLEKGQLVIDDPVSKYLPQFGKQQVAVLKTNDAGGDYDLVPALRQPTIQDLMRHTSGMVYGGRGATSVHKLYPAGSGAAADMTGAEFLDKLASLPLQHQPGAVWHYGFGIDVLGLVIERVSGEPLARYLDTNVFKPLDMKDTQFLIPAAKAKRYAKALPKDPDSGAAQSLADLTKPLKFDCGGGCLASTAADYLRFAQMLLNGGTLDGKRILGRKTVEYMLANQIPPGALNLIGSSADPTRADMGFGLGLAVQTTPGVVRLEGSVGTFTWPGASGTNWWGDPKEQLAVVFMAQSPGPIRWHYRYVVNALVNQAIVD